MKNKQLFCLLLVMLMMMLAACSPCEHQWEAANCKDPKTCRLCGDTTGVKNDDHQWEDATTDAPKTCSVCGLTEGDKIETDERFTTKACKEIFGNWVGEYEQKGSELGVGGETMVSLKLNITFFNNGEAQVKTELADAPTFKEDYAAQMKEAVYKNFESQAKAESWSMDTFGKSVSEYCAERATQIAAAMNRVEEMVYYVENGVIYMAEDWDSDMSASNYEMVDDGMMLDYSALGRELAMTRVGTEK